MKTLRLFGLTLMAVLLSVSFTSCSDDDEPIAIEQLEGTWIVTHYLDEWTDKETGEAEKEEYKFNASEEKNGMSKYVVKKTGDNSYTAEEFGYQEYSNSWNSYGTKTYKLNGQRLTNPDDEDDYYDIRSLDGTTMVLYCDYDNQDEKGHAQITLQKK